MQHATSTNANASMGSSAGRGICPLQPVGQGEPAPGGVQPLYGLLSSKPRLSIPPRIDGGGNRRPHSARSLRRHQERAASSETKRRARLPGSTTEPLLFRLFNAGKTVLQPAWDLWNLLNDLSDLRLLPGAEAASVPRQRLSVMQLQHLADQFSMRDGGMPEGDLKGRVVVLLYQDLDREATIASLHTVMRHAQSDDRLIVGNVAGKRAPMHDICFGLAKDGCRYLTEQPLNSIPYTEQEWDILKNGLNLSNWIREILPGTEVMAENLAEIKAGLRKASKRHVGQDKTDFMATMNDAIRMLELSLAAKQGFPGRKKNQHNFLRQLDAEAHPERTVWLALPLALYADALAAGLEERQPIVLAPTLRSEKADEQARIDL